MEVYALDMATKVWRRVEYGGIGPSPRVGHGVVALKRAFYVFGGRSGEYNGTNIGSIP
jgi:hypothetical protein